MTEPITDRKDRAAGAIVGAFIGDALGVGPHWYYDLEEMRHDHGDWIDGYTTPKPGRYHYGLKAGDLSQAGIILLLTARSLAECGGYDQADFCRRMDEELFPKLDGTAVNGPGGYTSQSIREAWRRRIKEGKPWGEVAGNADTTEAIERCLALAVRYAGDPRALAKHVCANAALTQSDEVILSMTVAYCAVLGHLVQGHALDAQTSDELMALVKSGDLPFHAVTSGHLQVVRAGDPEHSRAGRFASPDALLMPSFMAEAVADPGIKIEPAWKASIVYGMPCAVYFQLPAAYYLAARFRNDFESAVLHAINGGGQNQARAILTGALVGAQVGLKGIPDRFVEGLTDKVEVLRVASVIAGQVGEESIKDEV